MKIGIVTDRAGAAEALSRALSPWPNHQVIWTGDCAEAALHLCATKSPDLVLIALPLVAMNGVDVTRRIMTDAPCPILIVTDDIQRNAAVVFDAMGHGALDAVDMPALDAAHAIDRAAPLIAKIETIARLIGDKDVTSRPNGRNGSIVRGAKRDRLVAIGASAGGPAAVAAVLKQLPKNFSAAMVLVQHVDEEFVGGMTDWLGEQSGHHVTIAKEGERPAVSRVLVAGARGHLRMKTAERLGYVTEPRHYAYRPSVDVFFQSVSQLWPGDVVGVLLTGMGRDGALGLKALRDRGHHTIAQDEATSAVYGMPKAAATLQAAVDILPLDRIAGRLVDVIGCRTR